jgi:hypothetical protein
LLAGLNRFLDIEATVGEDREEDEEDEDDGESVGIPDLLSLLTIASIRWFYRG